MYWVTFYFGNVTFYLFFLFCFENGEKVTFLMKVSEYFKKASQNSMVLAAWSVNHREKEPSRMLCMVGCVCGVYKFTQLSAWFRWRPRQNLHCMGHSFCPWSAKYESVRKGLATDTKQDFSL